MTSRSAEEILKLYSAEVQALTNKARRLLLKLLPGAKESVDPSMALTHDRTDETRSLPLPVLTSLSWKEPN